MHAALTSFQDQKAKEKKVQNTPCGHSLNEFTLSELHPSVHARSAANGYFWTIFCTSTSFHLSLSHSLSLRISHRNEAC